MEPDLKYVLVYLHDTFCVMCSRAWLFKYPIVVLHGGNPCTGTKLYFLYTRVGIWNVQNLGVAICSR